MNVLVFGFHYDETVAELKRRRPDWNIVWIGLQKQRGGGAGCDYCWEDLQRGRVGEMCYSGAHEAVYPFVFKEFMLYLRMMTRVSGEGWVDWTLQDYINLFNLQYDFFANLYERHNPDIVVFSNLVHEGFDCVPYLLAKELDIPTLMACQSIFPNRFFCVTRIERFGLFADIPLFSECEPCFIRKQHFKEHPYLPLRSAHGLDFRTALKLGRLTWEKGPSRILQRFVRLRLYRRLLKAQMKKTQLDLETPFVYFALHMQPELTTTTIGGIYEDQILAVEKLSKRIPPDWLIYVKENPTQTEAFRGAFFFQRLARLPNVRLIPHGVSTFLLIKKSRFVATVTGTVGWEAITGGKNVLVFGYAWYRTFPGVFEFSERFHVSDILSYQIEHETIGKRAGEVLARMLPGVVNPAYAVTVDGFDADVNTKLVADGMVKYMLHVIAQGKGSAATENAVV